MVYGYCRISTPKQNIDRQVRNIVEYCTANNLADVKIKKEVYTGTKFVGRKEFENILKNVKSGDTIVFDSVSRMSRNATDGIKIYMELYEKGVNLIFIKEQYVNTEMYHYATSKTIEKVDNELANIYIEATNKVLMLLAQEQLKKAFEQAEKEVQDLHSRTKEGIETARKNGKQIGGKCGQKLHIKKADEAKKIIAKYNKDFGGMLNDKECIKLTNVSRNSYYKYKMELINDMTNQA